MKGYPQEKQKNSAGSAEYPALIHRRGKEITEHLLIHRQDCPGLESLINQRLRDFIFQISIILTPRLTSLQLQNNRLITNTIDRNQSSNRMLYDDILKTHYRIIINYLLSIQDILYILFLYQLL